MTARALASDVLTHLKRLQMSGGDRDGEQFKVLNWEAKFIQGAFRVHGPAALSVARGNGKSALVAGIATAVVDPEGPLHGRRREAVVVASSFAQARLIFEDAKHFLSDLHDLGERRTWRLQDSQNAAVIEHRPSGARLRCVGSDPSRAHGLRPSLALLDEGAQWPAGTSDRMLAAIRTGLGKVPGSKMVALGTRPADPAHWFEKMLTGGAAYSQVHAARPDDPPFQLKTWRRANPSLDHLPSLLREIREEAADAKADENMLSAFRALRLNLGVADTLREWLLSPDTWQRIEGAAEPAGRAVWGVDLGTSAAMSAIAAYWPETGRLDVLSAFPRDPGLGERGLSDGVGNLYVQGWKRGELVQCGDAAVDIPELLELARERFGAPSAIAADRWREAELRDAIKRAGMGRPRLVLRGMGFKDGGEDVRAFRRACLDGRVTPVPSLILLSAIAEARTISDPAGNSKLAKGSEGGRRLRARDDAVAAAILATSLGTRKKVRPSGVYLGNVAGAA